MKNVVVFFGGKSVEHDISVITGALTCNILKDEFNVYPVYVDKKNGFYTGEILFDIDEYVKLDYKKLKRVTFLNDNGLYEIRKNKIKRIADIYCAVNCSHGGNGESGALSGVMEYTEIPFVSPSVLPSAVSMDKEITKIALKGMGIKTLPCVATENLYDLEKKTARLGYPMIVKPACSGSSIGIAKANDKEELILAVLDALKYGKRAVIEKCLQDFVEINCAAYKNGKGAIIVSECERPFGKGEVLTFGDKYEKGTREFPANIPEPVALKIKETTAKVYAALKFKGVIRIDYMVKGEAVYLNEINSVPGSLSYYLFVNAPKEYLAVLKEVMAYAVKEYNCSTTYVKDFSTSLLKITGAKGYKKS